MWWCKLREAMVSIAEGEYESRMTCVDLQEFGQIAVRGRPVMEVQGPARSVYLDLIACSIIVDNALSNAFRHGCPDDPQVNPFFFGVGLIPWGGWLPFLRMWMPTPPGPQDGKAGWEVGQQRVRGFLR